MKLTDEQAEALHDLRVLHDQTVIGGDAHKEPIGVLRSAISAIVCLSTALGVARKRDPGEIAHIFRDSSDQEWAIDYDDSCYVLFFRGVGDRWQETTHWPRDAVEMLRTLPSNPRDYADAQLRKPRLRVVK